MKNDPLSAYWYFTRGNWYPHRRNVVESRIGKGYKVFSLTCEADVSAIKELGLTYLGYGNYNSVQVALMRAIKIH